MPYQSFGSSCGSASIELGAVDNEKIEAHLWVREEVEGLLVGCVGLLEVILHEVAVPWEMPG